jgi:hypothetical protein
MKLYKHITSFFTFGLLIFIFSACTTENNSSPGNAWNTEFSFGWKFAKGDQKEAVDPKYDDTSWENVDLPHDWAIYGPFGEPTEKGDGIENLSNSQLKRKVRDFNFYSTVLWLIQKYI